MRMALYCQWIRVHFSDKEYQGFALRYALISVFVQIVWALYLIAPHKLALYSQFMGNYLRIIDADADQA